MQSDRTKLSVCTIFVLPSLSQARRNTSLAHWGLIAVLSVPDLGEGSGFTLDGSFLYSGLCSGAWTVHFMSRGGNNPDGIDENNWEVLKNLVRVQEGARNDSFKWGECACQNHVVGSPLSGTPVCVKQSESRNY